MRPGTRPLLPFAPRVLTRGQSIIPAGMGRGRASHGAEPALGNVKKNPPTALQMEIPRPKVMGKEMPASRNRLPACQAFASDIVREQGVQGRCRPPKRNPRSPEAQGPPLSPPPPKPYLGSPRCLARFSPTSRPPDPVDVPPPARAPPPLPPRPARPQSPGRGGAAANGEAAWRGGGCDAPSRRAAANPRRARGRAVTWVVLLVRRG